MIEVRPLDLAGPIEVVPARHGDARGFFSETYSRKDFARLGIAEEFVQDNHSLSASRGTVRGLHYQCAPRAQAKLVRVAHGAVFDVAVDIRRGSPSFGRWVAVILSADAGNQLFVPAGFAHGFQTLTADTEIVYKVTDYYSRDHDRSIRCDDPRIGVAWPLPVDRELLSPKDRDAPLLDAAVPVGREVTA